jgi:hypothetical protein
MKSIKTISVAIVLGAVVAPALGERAVLAQDVAKANPRATAELTLSGCLLEGPQDQFHLIGAEVTPTVRGRADASGGLRPPDSLSWALAERGAQLDQHAGRLVEVSGRAEWDASLAEALNEAVPAPRTTPSSGTSADPAPGRLAEPGADVKPAISRPGAIGTSGRTASPEQSPGAAASTAVIVPSDAKTTTMSESAFDLEVYSVRALAPTCTE